MQNNQTTNKTITNRLKELESVLPRVAGINQMEILGVIVEELKLQINSIITGLFVYLFVSFRLFILFICMFQLF